MMGLMSDKVNEFIKSGKLSDHAGLSAVCKLLGVVITKIDWHEENGAYVSLLLSQLIGRT